MEDRKLKWLDRYSGQTTEQLLSLEKEYEIVSLVLAFEQGLDHKMASNGEGSVSQEELTIIAVEELEREVNNGGYWQFFFNTPEYASVIVPSLHRIGCPETAKITQGAIDALESSSLDAETVKKIVNSSDGTRKARLSEYDDPYYNNSEPIAYRLFEFIKANRLKINLIGLYTPHKI